MNIRVFWNTNRKIFDRPKMDQLSEDPRKLIERIIFDMENSGRLKFPRCLVCISMSLLFVSLAFAILFLTITGTIKNPVSLLCIISSIISISILAFYKSMMIGVVEANSYFKKKHLYYTNKLLPYGLGVRSMLRKSRGTEIDGVSKGSICGYLYFFQVRSHGLDNFNLPIFGKRNEEIPTGGIVVQENQELKNKFVEALPFIKESMFSSGSSTLAYKIPIEVDSII